MKQLFFKTIIASGLVLGALQVSSCKDKKASTEETSTTPSPDTMTSTPEMPAPVIVSSDDSLNNTLKDAVRDFPGVETSVSNGEVTLTGTIARADLPRLMKSVNALKPKKINQNLTVK